MLTQALATARIEPMTKRLEGWKEIAQYLTAAWGRNVQWWSAARYWKSSDDPMPGEMIRRRVHVDEAELRVWAFRQRVYRRQAR